jgi:glycosyltransferase involved in cell wall biosynthesis
MASNYLAITPAYNEESFLPGLISAIAAQTEAPAKWIIIDDGSSDRTASLIDEAAAQYKWITPVHLPRRVERAPGGESVVMRQLELHQWREFSHVFRVDADITLDQSYVAALLDRFAQDPLLGIASGMLYEPSNGSWLPNPEPAFQATGNCRIYSSKCLEAIGGIESGLGWDTIDVTSALMKGFHTRNFRDLAIYHHRPMQTANGRRRGRLNMGEAAYNAGYSPFFMAARSLRHAFQAPKMMGGALMMLGYVRCWYRRQPVLASRELVRFVRREQLKRLLGGPSVWR